MMVIRKVNWRLNKKIKEKGKKLICRVFPSVQINPELRRRHGL
jgi:hypothetical protein